jgi:transcriptional regulator with XRE-family HTH domain
MNLGLTQQTLARRLGCWYQTVASWERDESVPLAGRWPAIEALLGPGLVPEQEGLPGRILAARLRLGLTQHQLARQAMLDVRTVRNAELGVRSPSQFTLRRLGAVLGSMA